MESTTAAPAANKLYKSLLLPGTYWPEEGGIVAGIMKPAGTELAYYLILPIDAGAEAPEELEWGPYGDKVEGLSDWDGLENTRILAAREAKHPAAEWCAELRLHDKDDWYLPSMREALLAAANAHQHTTPGIHWTSSQSSANTAFVQDFSSGSQSSHGKGFGWRVRAVRRVLIPYRVLIP